MNPANESLSRCIDAFLAMVTVEKGLAKNTVEAYGRDLAGLARHPSVDTLHPGLKAKLTALTKAP